MNQYANSAIIYDVLMKPNPTETQFYRSFITRRSRVLELGCGTGRLSLELARSRMKCEYDCVDLSPHMLGEFRTKLGEWEARGRRFDPIHIIQDDMTAYQTNKRYHAVLYTHQSIQCLPKSQIIDQLRHTVHLLEDDGIVILSLFDPLHGFDESPERIIGSARYEDRFFLCVHDSFQVEAETVAYRQVVKIYNNESWQIEEIHDDFKIGNVDHDFIDEIARTVDLRLVGDFQDYQRHRRTSESSHFVLVLKKAPTNHGPDLANRTASIRS